MNWNAYLVQTAIMLLGLAVAVALALTGVSEYVIVVIAVVFGAVAGVYGYRSLRPRDGAGPTSAHG